MDDSNNESPAALASKFINHTNRNVFLTGKAGTGKTTFLKHIVSTTHKKTIIVAPTGIAAINAGGVTIHSLFQLPFGSFVPVNQSSPNVNFKVNDPLSLIKHIQMRDEKRKLLRELELLIIDEVSMLRADILDAMDVALRYVRRKNYLPFGGVQVLFIGDLLQLPPVIKDEEWNLLKMFYKSVFFFDARVLQNEKPVYIELDKIYRQADDTFISLLNNFRNNEVNADDIILLNKFYKPAFKPSANENYITLTTHNYKATNLNKDLLAELKSKSYYFDASIEGEFNEFAYPIEKKLELKTGAQVMFVKNDPTGAQRFFNGKIGLVSKLSDDEIEVQFDDATPSIIVEKYEWKNIKYEVNEVSNEIEEKTTGTFTQYPIKLAWAITVHKSQGLTFTKAILDIGSAFAPGQVYVALSRLRSLDGLVLTSPINYNGISQDSKVTEFSKIKSEQEKPNELIKRETILFLRNYLLQCFDFTQLVQKINEHVDTYLKAEKKSTKQKHVKWATELKNEVDEVKIPADKFMNQLANIIDVKEADYLEALSKRVASASNYFSSIFKKNATTIFKQIEKVKFEKKSKTYLKELLELEVLFYEQQKQVSKAAALCNSTINGTEFTKADMVNVLNEATRIEQINQAIQISVDTSDEQKIIRKEKPASKSKEKLGVKKEKIDTKAETLTLYKLGKTIAEIAQIRGFTTGTIETHLAFYIVKGELDVNLFISAEKIETIILKAKELDTFLATPIKRVLGDAFSYGDIKFAIASHLSKQQTV